MNETIEIVVNGSRREYPTGTTVVEVLRDLNFGETGVAVAVDRRVVPRSEHATTTLGTGAQLEVLRAVGGG